MAQDTHLFSVSKPRQVRAETTLRNASSQQFHVTDPPQTLGSIHHNSAIPQPSSALKRSSSVSGFKGHHLDAPATVQHTRSQSGTRMSMAPSRPPPQPNFGRSSSGANLNNMERRRMSYAPGSGNTLMTPHHGQSTMSLAPAPTTVQRRSSVWSSTRPSSGPAVGQQPSFFNATPVTAGVHADPRRLRDRHVQTQMISDLEQFVNDNNFSMEMKHNLQPGAFRGEKTTTKDFQMIFQWLYKRIDPGYVFQKNMDTEVPALLSQVRYPFAKSITRSMLAAIGGQNWHVLLGMLHWMMQLGIMMQEYVNGRYDQAVEDEGLDLRGDRIVNGFLSRAYTLWSNCPEEMPDDEVDALIQGQAKEMAQQFEDIRGTYVEDLERLEAENDSLLKQIEEQEAAMPDLDKLDKDRDLLEADVVKFEEYAKKQENRRMKTEEKIRTAKEELQKCEEQIREASDERAGLQAAIDAQGIKMERIDDMNRDRERVQDDMESTRQRLEETQAKIKDIEREASTKLARLEDLAREYNTLCYAVDIRDEEYELIVQVNEESGFSASQSGVNRGGDRLLADSETGYHPARVLNRDMREIKKDMSGRRREVDERRTTAKSKDEEIKRLIFDTSQAIDDQRREVDTLQHRSSTLQDEHEKTKDVADIADQATSTAKSNSTAEIERTEKELARMRGSLTDDVQMWEQKEMNAEIEYEQLSMQASALREELHTEVEHMLDYIIKFKLHVQKSLEEFESLVEEETESELKFDQQFDQKAMEDAKEDIEAQEKMEEDDEEL